MARFVIKKPQTKRLQKRFIVTTNNQVEYVQNYQEPNNDIIDESFNDIIEEVQEPQVDTNVVEEKIMEENTNVMDTKEKIQTAAEILDTQEIPVKKIKKEKGLIERTESSKTIITEDNRELLRG